MRTAPTLKIASYRGSLSRPVSELRNCRAPEPINIVCCRSEPKVKVLREEKTVSGKANNYSRNGNCRENRRTGGIFGCISFVKRSPTAMIPRAVALRARCTTRRRVRARDPRSSGMVATRSLRANPCLLSLLLVGPCYVDARSSLAGNDLRSVALRTRDSSRILDFSTSVRLVEALSTRPAVRRLRGEICFFRIDVFSPASRAGSRELVRSPGRRVTAAPFDERATTPGLVGVLKILHDIRRVNSAPSTGEGNEEAECKSPLTIVTVRSEFSSLRRSFVALS